MMRSQMTRNRNLERKAKISFFKNSQNVVPFVRGMSGKMLRITEEWVTTLQESSTCRFHRYQSVILCSLTYVKNIITKRMLLNAVHIFEISPTSLITSKMQREIQRVATNLHRNCHRVCHWLWQVQARCLRGIGKSFWSTWQWHLIDVNQGSPRYSQ